MRNSNSPEIKEAVQKEKLGIGTGSIIIPKSKCPAVTARILFNDPNTGHERVGFLQQTVSVEYEGEFAVSISGHPDVKEIVITMKHVVGNIVGKRMLSETSVVR